MLRKIRRKEREKCRFVTVSEVLLNKTHIPYYDYRDGAVTQNDQVFQQAIATARHLEVRKRRLEGANENVLFELLRNGLYDPR